MLACDPLSSQTDTRHARRTMAPRRRLSLSTVAAVEYTTRDVQVCEDDGQVSAEGV